MSLVGATISFSTMNHLMRTRQEGAAFNAKSSDALKTLKESAEPDAVKSKSTSETEDSRDAKSRAADQQKNRAREMLQRLVEELKLVKKLWAHDLKGMAKQIARIAEQLKEALELYKDAHEALHGKSGGMVGLPAGVSGLAVAPAAPVEAPQNEAKTAEADAKSAEADAEAMSEQGVAAAEDAEADAGEAVKTDTSAHSLATTYKKPKFETYRLDQTDEAIALRGDFEFMDIVRGLKKKLVETLQDTKDKAIFQVSGKAENSAEFKDAEKVIEDLEEDLKSFERDLKRQMPPAIMVSRLV